MKRAIPVLLLALAAATAEAQNVSTDPLQCWWRTSAGAVRVGEPFAVVLTCAVLETDAATVVVDQSRLEPSVVQFAPFEVLGGSHGADMRSDQRRFFQYEYRLRLITENMFGKDAALPDTKISYRVQSKVGQNTAIQGRDQTYMMPAQSIKILSLVPADASDIRDSSAETFGDIDRRGFRANLFSVVGAVLFVVAGLLALLTAVRIFRRYRTPATVAERPITDAAILRGAGAALRAVKRDREDGGWTPELAGRALAALRIPASYAIGRKIGIAPRPRAQADQPAPPGGLLLRTGWPKTRTLAVSGSATSQTVVRTQARGESNASRAAMLDRLSQALTTFTIAQYGRAETKLDDGALDHALSTAFEVLKRVRLEQTWFMKRLAAWRGEPVPVDSRVWSR